jgi:hypothetical protein
MGDDGVEPTELAGVAEAENESVHAWALDDDEDEIETRRLTPRRITEAALAGCLVLIAAAGLVALLVIRGAWQIEPAPLPVVAAPPSPPAPSTAAPTTKAVRAQPAPPGPWITPTKPVTVTVQAPPKTIQAAQPPVTVFPSRPPLQGPLPDLIPYDRQFIANLQARDWVVWNPALMAQRGQEACVMLRDGEPRGLISQKLVGVEPQLTLAMAWQFTEIVSDTYPNCP